METKINNQMMAYLQKNVGTNIYINSISSEKGSNKIKVNIGVSIPKMIYDDSIRKQYLKFIKFDNVISFFATINKEGIKAEIDSKKVYDLVARNEDRLKYQVEDILLDKFYPNLVDIPLIRTFLRPIYTILSEVFYNGVISKEKIETYPNKERLEKYIHFLKDFEIIRESSNGDYNRGNIPIKIQSALKKKDESEVLRYVFGYVIKEGRKYIREELHLSMVESSLRVMAAYYMAALSADKVIAIDKNTFYEELSEQYPDYHIHEYKFLSNLNDLTSAKILNTKNNFFFGDEKFLNHLKKSLSIRKKEIILN
jgi:hypothetical protein